MIFMAFISVRKMTIVPETQSTKRKYPRIYSLCAFLYSKTVIEWFERTLKHKLLSLGS